ncbi:MAG: ribonuclease III [Myxococcota bacterium]
MRRALSDPDAAPLLERIGWQFHDSALLRAALTHASRAHEEGGGPGNERLEFLGDAVLDLIITEFLFEAQPEWREGELTRARAALVNREALAARAREIELGSYARLGKTELRDAGARKETILANLFEALVGALYLDGGLETARRFLAGVYAEALPTSEESPARDPKTRLQEWSHSAMRETPRYRVVSDSGVENDAARFRVEVRLGDRAWGEGRARSKRAAERSAAVAALQRVGEDG